jgi:hypothetical protein
VDRRLSSPWTDGGYKNLITEQCSRGSRFIGSCARGSQRPFGSTTLWSSVQLPQGDRSGRSVLLPRGGHPVPQSVRSHASLWLIAELMKDAVCSLLRAKARSCLGRSTTSVGILRHTVRAALSARRRPPENVRQVWACGGRRPGVYRLGYSGSQTERYCMSTDRPCTIH